MDLKDRTAIITGAARGMGKEFAGALAEAGVHLAICDVKKGSLEKTAAWLREKHEVTVISEQVDVSLEAEVDSFVRLVQEELGRIDILINNAAINPLHSIDEICSEEWDRVLAVNLKSCFFFAKAVVERMRKQKFGRIINISSEAGKTGGTNCGLHYAVSKAGILGFTRHLAKKLGQDGITVKQ